MGFLTSYQLRWQRKQWKLRALAKGRELKAVQDRTQQIDPDAILLFCTLRNEDQRLPYFLKYYRDLGIDHFLMVDNNSDDGGAEFLGQK